MEQRQRSDAAEGHTPQAARVALTELQSPPTRQALQDTELTLIDLDEELRFLLSSANTQIDSPSRIEAALLRPFLEGREKLLLLPKGKAISPARLEAVHETSLLATTYEAEQLWRQRALVLPAVFPVSPRRYYVLQTRIEALQTNRLKLRYLDPRYDVRRQFPLPTPVSVRLAPPLILTALTQRQMRVVRVLTRPRGEPQAAGDVVDRLYEKRSGALSPHMALFADTPALAGGLKDLSLGGACLTVDSVERPEEWVQGLALLQLSLPAVSGRLPAREAVAVSWQLLGVIRVVRATGRSWTLHFRFLKRLPQVCEPLLESLEHDHFREALARPG